MRGQQSVQAFPVLMGLRDSDPGLSVWWLLIHHYLLYRFIAVGAVKGQDERAKGGAAKVPRAPGKVSSRRTTKTNPKVVEALHALLAASAKVGMWAVMAVCWSSAMSFCSL